MKTTGTFLILFLAGLASAQISVSPGTTIQVGEVVEGKKVTAVWTLTNSSSEKQVIGHLQPACGCTTAEPTRKELGPGESSEIKVIFDSANRLGDFHKPVTVYINGSTTTQVELVLVGKVINPEGPKLELDQNRIDLGVCAYGKPVRREMTLRNRGNQVLVVTQIEMAKQKILASPVNIQPNSSYVVDLVLQSPGTPGLYSEYLTISTNDPVVKRQIVSVVGWFEARLGVTIVKEKEFNLFYQVRIVNDSPDKVKVSDFIPGDKYEIASGKEVIEPGSYSIVQVMKGTLGTLKF